MVLLVTLSGGSVCGESSVSVKSEVSLEYQVKAAFIYNFLKFTEWPRDKKDDETITDNKSNAIVIGVVGKYQFEKAFDPILSKTVSGRPILIKRFVGITGYKEKSGDEKKYKEEYAAKYADELKKCQVLYICSSEDEYLTDILSMIEGSSILTIGEKKDFANRGGIINFVMEQDENKAKKLRFEVNLDSLKKSGITISSKLLKLAKRVIKDVDKSEMDIKSGSQNVKD